ncbi:hypothetical protein PFISCL1PPCAC_21477, partial [Pristionchus fissidentatus]
MNQSKQIAKKSYKKIDNRIGEIDIAIKKLRKTLELGKFSSDNLSIRLCQKTMAVERSKPVRNDAHNLLMRPIDDARNSVLKLSFPANILSVIANLGKSFLTNMGTDGNSAHHIQTIPTEIVASPGRKGLGIVDNLSDLALFSRFHVALTRHGRYTQFDSKTICLTLALDFASIGKLVAPLIMLPNPSRSMAVKNESVNADEDSGLRLNDLEMPVLSIEKDVNYDPVEPGPSSPKRI